MYEVQFDYIKPKHGEKPKLFYTDTNSLIVQINTNGISRGIAEDVETRFHNSNYELNRPLPK